MLYGKFKTTRDVQLVNLTYFESYISTKQRFNSHFDLDLQTVRDLLIEKSNKLKLCSAARHK